MKSYKEALGETVPMPTHFKYNGYKTLAAGKIFHKGTSDIMGIPDWLGKVPQEASSTKP